MKRAKQIVEMFLFYLIGSEVVLTSYTQTSATCGSLIIDFFTSNTFLWDSNTCKSHGTSMSE